MLRAGLHTLDDHSAYYNKEDSERFKSQQEGTFVGIGVQIAIDRDTGRLMVISPIANSPADQAGIQRGDEIEQIDEFVTRHRLKDTTEATKLIQGPIGSTVKLVIRSPGAAKGVEKTIQRRDIKLDILLGDQRHADKSWNFMLDPQEKIGYLRLSQFNDRSAKEIREVLLSLKQQGMKHLIFDLRFNPGGSLTAAVEIAALFIERGDVVTIRGRDRPIRVYEAFQARQEARDENAKLLFSDEGAQKLNLVVLINQESASASEIVAAALQDHARATIVGRRSFGKGSVLNIMGLGEHGQLKLTTAMYYRPSGKNIDRSTVVKKAENAGKLAAAEDEDGQATPVTDIEKLEWGVTPDVLVTLTKTEEQEYWEARRDRDIIRRPVTDADVQALQSAVVAALGVPSSQVLSPLDSIAVLQCAKPQLEAIPRKFVDRDLEAAIRVLRGAQAATREGPRP
jgi:carboxyl-terminal processing protease